MKYRVTWLSTDSRWNGATIEEYFTDFIMAQKFAYTLKTRNCKGVLLQEEKENGWVSLPDECIQYGFNPNADTDLSAWGTISN